MIQPNSAEQICYMQPSKYILPLVYVLTECYQIYIDMVLVGTHAETLDTLWIVGSNQVMCLQSLCSLWNCVAKVFRMVLDLKRSKFCAP